MTFSAIDVFFVLVIAVFALMAAVKGLVAEFFGKAAMLGGLGAALFFYNKLAPFVEVYVKNYIAAQVLSFLLIFITVYLIMKIIQYIVAAIFSGEILGGLNHALGFLFGAAEGFIVISFIIIVIREQPWISADSLLANSLFESLFSSCFRNSSQYVKGIFA